MQAEQTEHLRKLVDASSILTPAEKADWLDMLVLMNDKQASELELILKAQQPAAASSAPTPPAVPKNLPSSGAMPPLSHISNLPSGLGASIPRPQTRPAPRPSVSPPRAMPWQKQFQASMEEKELPPPKPASRPPVAPAPIKPVMPKPQAPRAPRPPVAPAEDHRGPVNVETLSDVGAMTAATLRNTAFSDLLIRLQQLSKLEGYFNLLSYIEDSPLYKSYIATGQKVLSEKLHFDQAGRIDPNTLTKEEFEGFTDILRKIQIN